MKPTSLIFLALSLILLFCGFMTCHIAEGMAKNQGVKLYDQEINDEGDYVYTYKISNDSVAKLNVNFSDVNINIYGTDSQSYVELKNFDVNSYKTTVSGESVTIESDFGFLSSLLNISGSGLEFKGLRHFLIDKPDPEKVKTVNIYLSNNSELKSLTVNSLNGNVYCKNAKAPIDYFINASNSNVFFDKVETSTVAVFNISNGNASITTSKIASLSVTIDAGNLELVSNGAYSSVATSYNLSVNEGVIKYNEDNIGTKHVASSSEPEFTITANIGKGNITATDDNKKTF